MRGQYTGLGGTFRDTKLSRQNETNHVSGQCHSAQWSTGTDYTVNRKPSGPLELYDTRLRLPAGSALGPRDFPNNLSYKRGKRNTVHVEWLWLTQAITNLESKTKRILGARRCK